MPYCNNTKYPRTLHLPFSLGATNDDKIAQENYFDLIKNKTLVLTEKLDGQNQALMTSGVYARSHTSIDNHKWSENLTKEGGIYDMVKHYISDDEIVFGENLYAIHSIEYNQLEHFFFMFAVRDNERWYSWEEVMEMSEILAIPHVPIRYIGSFSTEKALEEKIKEIMEEGSCFGDTIEGVVVRNFDSFKLEDFQNNVFKYVRANHVQTDIHWTKNWRKATLKY